MLLRMALYLQYKLKQPRQEMKYLIVIFILLTNISCHSQTSTYKFDNASTVNGCTNVYLQKISKDLQYELLIEIQFDSIPKFKEVDIIQYGQFIKVYLNKYPKKNEYVNEICNDIVYIDKKAKLPVKYLAIRGSLTINFMSDKGFVISALAKNLLLQSKSKDKINIPFEFFDKLQVGWKGG